MTHRTDNSGRYGSGLMSAAVSHHEFHILETVPVGVLVLRGDTTLLYANDAAHALFGDGTAVPNLVDTLRPVDGRALRAHLHDGHQFEATVSDLETERQVTASVAKLGGAGQTDFVVSLTDITDFKRATERAEFLAHHDPLTRLGNRTLLQSVWDALERRLRHGEVEVHAMALDLDRFKEVNDVHGHAMGDLVLRQAANRIRLAVAEAGQVFRFGGDEFFVLAEGGSRTAAVAVGRRIVEDLRRPMTVLGHEIVIGCSVGIASGPLDGTQRDALHRAADLALYDVKRAGRGNVACFDPRQEQALLDRRLLQADLVLAIADNSLELAFLPQFDSDNAELAGAEVSITWTNARNGQRIGSEALLSLAQEAGLSHLLDLWTIRTAVARFAERRDGGWACPRVAIGVATTTLLRADTADAILRILAEHELPPERLEIQIAEGSVLATGSDLAPVMRHLAGAGVRIAIDGFCSHRHDLSYLRSLGVGRIKFDRSIAVRMLGEADADALTGAIWTLCQRLAIEMSADGIETPQQWDQLRRLGRLRAQGAFFGEREAETLRASGRRADEASG
ncbi:putative bifunctional diguanylate cyclase/phosphodiesterase [Aureimonas flava]|uniref:putative bifunctional diguanylate cyclase/phosphodiesterase n=1 Tax=Aureimonas flava TaxID=2320271 RepID=UPI00145A01CD|nr:EAL domain-containing protein [Aureimonas flava]